MSSDKSIMVDGKLIGLARLNSNNDSEKKYTIIDMKNWIHLYERSSFRRVSAPTSYIEAAFDAVFPAREEQSKFFKEMSINHHHKKDCDFFEKTVDVVNHSASYWQPTENGENTRRKYTITDIMNWIRLVGRCSLVPMPSPTSEIEAVFDVVLPTGVEQRKFFDAMLENMHEKKNSDFFEGVVDVVNKNFNKSLQSGSNKLKEKHRDSERHKNVPERKYTIVDLKNWIWLSKRSSLVPVPPPTSSIEEAFDAVLRTREEQHKFFDDLLGNTNEKELSDVMEKIVDLVNEANELKIFF